MIKKLRNKRLNKLKKSLELRQKPQKLLLNPLRPKKN
jgi:hypothetical protein